MIKQFSAFYRYLNCISYIEFCNVLGKDKTDLWAKEKWLSLHSNIGAWICNNEDSAGILLDSMEDI